MPPVASVNRDFPFALKACCIAARARRDDDYAGGAMAAHLQESLPQGSHRQRGLETEWKVTRPNTQRSPKGAPASAVRPAS